MCPDAAELREESLAKQADFLNCTRPAQSRGGPHAGYVTGVLAYQRALERSERAERIGEIEKEVQANPDKVKPAWDLASAKLEEYVARNLSHVAWIFVLVVIVTWSVATNPVSHNVAVSLVYTGNRQLNGATCP